MPSIDPETIAIAVLGGSFVTAIGALWRAKTNAKKVGTDIKTIEANRPFEMTATMLKGSEDAMLIMEKANDRLVAEVARKDQELAQSEGEKATLREENIRLHGRVEALEGRLETVQTQLSDAHRIAADLSAALTKAQEGYDGLQRELAEIKKS